MTFLDDAITVVYTPGELSTALSSDNGIDYIYLGADINMTSGIRIDPAKTSVIIDGLYLPESPDIRTLTDTGLDGGQIYMNSITAQGTAITFQNLIINGRNYFGMPFIYDIVNAEYVTVTYQNVTYTGPQMIWHPRGLMRLIDCDVTIVRVPPYSPTNEIAEINRVEIGGRTIIRHNNLNDNAAFLFYKANPYFTILEGADVEITSMREFFRNEGVYYVPFTIQPRAHFVLSTVRGISLDSGHRAASVSVGEDAVFRYTRETNAGNLHTFYVNGAFTVGTGADVYMQADFLNTGSMVRFMSSSASLNSINAKSFAIYNRGTVTAAAVFSFAGSVQIPFRLVGEQVNCWDDAALFPLAGTLDDIPSCKWNRPDWSGFELSGTASSSLTDTTYNDFTPEELADLPPLSDLQLQTARVFSIGNLPLSVDPITTGPRPITGRTAAKARIRVVYAAGDRPECDADDSGNFTLAQEVPLPFSELVTVYSNTPFLIVSLTATAEDEGELSLKEAPDLIEFEIRPFATNPVVLLPRKDYEAPVVVTDTRYPEKTEWQLWAKIEGPLTTEDGDVLDDAVVFARPDGSLITLGTTYVSVHTDGPYPDDDETPVSWDIDKGILARITVPVRSGKRYTAQMFWDVYPTGVEPEESEQP